MKSFPLFASGFLALLLPGVGFALEIRDYDPQRHDRFTGFPMTPAWNPTSWVSSVDYSGIGWSVTEPRRQFALISPQHVLLSAQWPLAAGESIRFLANWGEPITRTLESTVQILDNGVGTDLLLGRLSEPVPAGFTPLRHSGGAYAYAGQPTLLHVFGANATVGAGQWWPNSTLRDAGTGPTRSFAFSEVVAAGAPDDCHFTSEDIGSPSCFVFEGRAALAGIHSASEIDETGAVYSNFDSLVSAYLPQLDALMAADGWRMMPVGTPPLPLGMSAAIPAPLVRTQPGEMIFQMPNPSAYENGNVRVTLSFNAGTAPDSIAADGWHVDEAGPLQWRFHRAALPALGSVSLKATWSAVPDVQALGVGILTSSDVSGGMGIPYVFLTEAPPVVEEPDEPEPVLEHGNAIHYRPEHASDRSHGWWNPKQAK